MPKSYSRFAFALFCVFIILSGSKSFGQCAPCAATTFNVDLSSTTDTVWKISSTRSGSCCSGTNCIRFNILLNPGSDLLNFDVINPAPSGAGTYDINCDTAVAIGTPACIGGMTSVCIAYCKVGGDSPEYVITATRTVQASPDLSLRQGCTGVMTVSGLQQPSITWNSVFPGAAGAYNSYLSCVAACDSTLVTPAAGAPPYIDYVVSGTPNTSCPGTSTDTIRVYTTAPLIVAATPDSAVLCSGGPGSVSLSVTASGGSGPYSYLWSTGATTQTISVSSPGTYVISVDDTASACPPITDTVVVTAAPTPAAPTISSNSPICEAQTLNLSAATVSGATYSWAGPSGFVSSAQNPSVAGATSVNAGTYTANVTVNGCTSANSSLSVTVNAIPAAPTASSTSPVCTGTTLSLAASTIAGASYTWTGPNGFTSNVQNPTISGVTAAAAGTYSVTATVAGCPGPAGTTPVTVNTTPAAPAVSNNGPVCAGSSLNFTASTISGATYSWTGPNGFTSSSQNPSISSATTAATGSYSVTATVTGCTSAAATTTATVNAIPATPTASSNSPVCSGNTVSLTTPAVTGATYSWTGPNGFTSALQNPTISSATTAAGGTYFVTVTVNGCTSSQGSTSVVVNSTPSAPSVTSNSPVCSGNTLNLSTPALVGATYSWTGPNGFTSNLQNPSIANVTTSATGTYSVAVSVNGCGSASGSTAVVVNSTPVAPTASSNSPICVGATLNLTSNAVTGAGYLWSGPNGFTSTSQNPTISGVTAAATGAYTVTHTVNGCTGPAATVNVLINNPPGAPTAGSNSPVCTGGTLTLSASTIAGATYTWTGPNGFTSTLQNPSIANVTSVNAGTYSVTANNGCTGPAGSVSVSVNNTPATPAANSNSPVCAGSTISFTATTISGATYSWSGPNGFTSTLQNPSISGATSSNTGTYSVTATVNGCTSAAGTESVTVNPIPATPAPSNNSPVCTGGTLSLTTAAVTGATYSWTGPNGFSSVVQNPTITSVTAAAAGTYSLVVTVAGCPSLAGTTSVTVNTTPSAPAASSNSPVCAGSTLNLSASTIASATYSWSGPNGFTSTSQNPSVSAITSAGAGTYSVTATVNGCTSAAGTTTVTVNPIPATPTAGSNSPLCVGGTLTLTSSTITGASYSWTGPNGFTAFVQNPSISSVTTSATGTYSVVATVNGCPSLAGTVNVTINSAPATPVVSSNSPVCSGNSIQLTTDTIAGATYSWSGPNGFTSTLQNPVIASSTTAMGGTYTVIANNGCASSPASVSVTVNQTPAALTLGSNSPICDGANINLTANTVSGGSYSWTGPNSFTSTVQNPSISAATFTNAGTYTSTVTVNGCTSPASTTSVTVNPIPSTPSPLNNSPVCSGNTLMLSTAAVSGATYTWTGPNGFTSALQNPSITNITTAGAGTYSVTVTVLGCTSSAGSTTATILSTPATPAPTNTGPVCEGSPITFNTATVTGGTYSWTGPGGFSSSDEDPTISATSAASAGTYSVVVTVNGCPSAAGSTTAVINPIPATPVPSSNSPVCIGSTLSFTTPSVTGASYNWTGPNGFTSTLQNPGISNATTAATGNYDLTVTVNGCTSAAGTIFAAVNAAPITPTASSNSPVCSGTTLQLAADSIPGATFSWTGPSGFTSTQQNPQITNVTLAASGTYTVIADNGCASSPASTSVTVNATPSQPSASTNAPVCQGSTITLSVATIAGATYSWTGPGGYTSFTQNNNITNADSTNVGDYLVTASANGCTSIADTVSVIVDQPALVNAGSPVTVCGNNSLITLSGTVSGGTNTGLWSSSGSGAFNPSASDLNAAYQPSSADTAAGSVTLTLSSTNNGACTAVTSSLSVTITNAPLAYAGNDQTVCANNPNAQLSGIVSVATGGFWSSSGTGTFIPDSSDLSATYFPSAADTTAGSVVLTLTTSGNGSCLAVTDQMTINYYAAPVANAGPDQILCLSNPTATLDGEITGGGGTGFWSTSGTGSFSPSSSDLNASYTPSSADTASGSVILVLTSTNNGGCNAVSDTVVLAYAGIPIVAAGADQVVCGNNSLVTLSGSVTGGGSQGVWSSSGTGMFSPDSTALNATYSPSSADTASGSVVLTLTSTNGCVVVTDNLIVSITDAPAVLAGPDLQKCTNNPDATIDASIFGGATTGTWSTDGTGTISPNTSSIDISYFPSVGDLAAGSVTLILTSTNNGDCFAVSDTVVITFTAPPVAAAGADFTMCANSTGQLAGTITAGSGTGIWSSSGSGSFSPSATDLNALYVPSSSDTSAGSVTITLTSTNNGGCFPATDDVFVTITDAPNVYAGADQNVCANNSVVTLNGAVSVASGGVWSTTGAGAFADSTALNTTYTPDSTDLINGSVSFILTSTGNGNCIPVRDTVNVSVSPAPVVNAGSDMFICTGTMTANLSGSISGGSITGDWSTLGSGSFSSVSDPNATYNLSSADTSAGEITLVLTSTNNGTCIPVSDTVKIKITTIPVTSAGADQTVCANNGTIGLTGSVTGGSGTGEWSTAGDGSFSPDNNDLAALYTPGPGDTTAGFATLILAPTDACLVIPDTVQITITPAPFVEAGNNEVICGNGTVTLNGIINSVPMGAYWTTTGTGTFQNDSSLSTIYIPGAADTVAGGVYLVLTSYGNGLCLPARDSIRLTVGQTPQAMFASTKACTGKSVTFTDLSTTGIGTVSSWSWDFGSGNTSSLQNPTFTFNTVGSYPVTLVATSSLGCSDTVQIIVNANPTPTAGFTSLTSCGSMDASFTDMTSGATITSWSWNFGDSTTGPVQNPIHTYSSSGNYIVELEVTSDSLCNDNITDTIFISEPILAGFASAGSCSNEITFTDTTQSGSDSLTTWNWTFGDGMTSTQQNPIHVYSAAGEYDVTLIVAGQSGCSDTIMQTITVAVLPVADFTPASGSFNSGTDIQFTDISTDATSWIWYFGDNDSSDVQNPTHVYNDNGTFTVTLIITSSGGCKDTAVHTLDIQGGVVAVPSAFTPNGDGFNDILFVRGGPFEELEFRVYNEWGNMIFESSDASTGWDGTYKGQIQPAGTYIYTVTGKTLQGEEINKHGDVTIIR